MDEALPYHPHHLHDNNLVYQPPPPHTLPSQFEIDPNDPFQFNAQFDVQSPIPPPQPPRSNGLDPGLQHARFHEIQPHIQTNPTPRRSSASSRPQGGQFGILTPHNQLPHNLHRDSFGRLQTEIDLASATGGLGSSTHFRNLKVVPDPPDLEAWRERLFNVSEPIELTEDE